MHHGGSERVTASATNVAVSAPMPAGVEEADISGHLAEAAGKQAGDGLAQGLAPSGVHRGGPLAAEMVSGRYLIWWRHLLVGLMEIAVVPLTKRHTER